MTKRILAFFFLLVALSYGSAIAQETQPKFLPLRAPCENLVNMANTVATYGEELLFIGQGMSFSGPTGQPFTGGMMFFVNQETGTWTMLQLFGDGMACILFNGGEFVPYTGPQPSAPGSDK